MDQKSENDDGAIVFLIAVIGACFQGSGKVPRIIGRAFTIILWGMPLAPLLATRNAISQGPRR